MRACRSVSYYALLTAFSSVHATHPDIHSFPTRRSSDIHPARHAERIEHHVDRRPVLEIRHVLVRNDPRHHTLVAMPPGHLVARLDLALHRYEDLDHLHDARRELVAPLQLLDLVEEAVLEALLRLLILLPHRLELGQRPLVLQRDVPPLRARHVLEHRLGDLALDLVTLRPARGDLADQEVGKTPIGIAVQDGELVVAVLGKALDLLPLDGKRALVLVDAMAVEHPDLDHGARHAGRQPERGVAHIGRLLAEDRPQQLLLGRHRALALWRDLADQNVARLHLGTDIDDAGLVEVLQRLLADIRDVAGDLLRAELGVARHDVE